jgi:hypothetical protein
MMATADLFSKIESSELVAEVQRAFQASLLPGETFSAEGNGDADGVRVLLRLATPDRSSVLSLEAGMEIPETGRLNTMEARALAVEFLISWLHEWFSNERWPNPPLDWQPMAWGTRTIHLRGSMTNSQLEDMADAMLAAAGYDTDK